MEVPDLSDLEIAHPDVPRWVLQSLVMYKGQLEERGAIQTRRDHKQPSYRVEFRGYDGSPYRKHLTIPIPQEAVPAVKKLLGKWRAKYQAKRGVKEAALEAEKARERQEKLEAREERAALRLMIGGTEWRQRKMLREWDQINKLGLMQSAMWLATKQYQRVDKPGTKNSKKTRIEEAQRLGLYLEVDVQKVVREKIRERRERMGLAAVEL